MSKFNFPKEIKKLNTYKSAARVYIKLRNSFLHIGHLKSDKVDLIRIINLKYRPERLNKTLKNLLKCSVPIKRFNAIDGSRFDSDYLRKYAPHTHRALTKGQVACFLSHRNCWLECLEQDGSIFWIMEDDARIKYFYAKHIDKWIKEIEDKDPHWDIIYTFKHPVDFFYDRMFLQDDLPATDKSERHYDQSFTKHSVVSGPSTCLAGYLLSKRGIEKLLKITEKIIYPVDVQIPLKHKEINMYAFRPLISYQDQDGISDSSS